MPRTRDTLADRRFAMATSDFSNGCHPKQALGRSATVRIDVQRAVLVYFQLAGAKIRQRFFRAVGVPEIGGANCRPRTLLSKLVTPSKSQTNNNPAFAVVFAVKLGCLRMAAINTEAVVKLSRLYSISMDLCDFMFHRAGSLYPRGSDIVPIGKHDMCWPLREYRHGCRALRYLRHFLRHW